LKILFFSDIHGNKYVIPNLVKAFETIKPDRIIFCGDIYGYYYHQDEIIDFFKQFHIEAIKGNHDKYFIDLINKKANLNQLTKKYGNSYKYNLENYNQNSIEYISELSDLIEFSVLGKRIGVFHGSPDDFLHDRIYPDTEIINDKSYSKYDYVILGHTHHKMIRKLNETIIINPGSIGQQRDGLGFSYLLLDLLNNDFKFYNIQFDIELLVSDIKSIDPGIESLIEVLYRKRPSKTP